MMAQKYQLLMQPAPHLRLRDLGIAALALFLLAIIAAAWYLRPRPSGIHDPYNNWINNISAMSLPLHGSPEPVAVAEIMDVPLARISGFEAGWTSNHTLPSGSNAARLMTAMDGTDMYLGMMASEMVAETSAQRQRHLRLVQQLVRRDVLPLLPHRAIGGSLDPLQVTDDSRAEELLPAVCTIAERVQRVYYVAFIQPPSAPAWPGVPEESIPPGELPVCGT